MNATKISRSPGCWRSFVLCSFALSIVGCGHKASPPEQSSGTQIQALPIVDVAPAWLGGIEQTLPITGTLVVPRDRQSTVVPAVSGILDQLSIHPGDIVTRGEVVAHISTRLLAGQIEQAQAAVAQNQVQVQQAQANFVQQQATTQTGIAQAQSAVAGAKATLMGVDATLDGDKAALQNAQQALERSLTLQNDGLVARKDVESAQLAVQTAKSQIEAQQRAVDAQQQIVESQKSALEAARAGRLQNDVKHKDVEIAQQEVRNALGALKSAQSQVALYTLRAPLSGVVSNVDASVGENVDTTTKLAVIDNLGTMQIQLAIPADSVRDVHPGQEVSFTVDGQPGKIYRTTVKLVSTQVDPGSNTIQATGEVDNPRGVLSNGLFARANIVLDRHHNVCLVPKSAVLRDDAGQTNIAVVGTGDTVHMTHVQTGISNGDLMEIVSGIEPGQRVATTGAYGLPDGTKVAVGRGEPNQ